MKGKARGQARRRALCQRALASWDRYVQANRCQSDKMFDKMPVAE